MFSKNKIKLLVLKECTEFFPVQMDLDNMLHGIKGFLC